MLSLICLIIGSAGFDMQIPTPEQRMLLHGMDKQSAKLKMPGDYRDPGHDFDVLDYDIRMTVDIPDDTVWAAVTIKAEALSDTLDTLNLNLHWIFKIDSVKEENRSLTWASYVGSLKIAIGRQVSEGETLSVAIYYHGKPMDGLFIQNGSTDNAYVYTNCEPEGARNWIPCYDAPSDKATFTQNITVPSGNRVVANGVLESSQTTGAWWTYTWREHYPQATYLIAFAASKHFLTKDTFAVVGAKHVPMRAWVLESNDVRTKFDVTPAILEHFSKIFPPFPFADEKYDHVHAPIGGAMENTTCTFINTDYDWGGGDWTWVIAHELSHDWWGDWLTCATWADIWLNEGFATYCEVLWCEKALGPDAGRAYISSTMDFYFQYGNSHPIYDPVELFGANSYEKGGSVLYMLHELLGDSLFFAGMNKYALDNANESVITDDFQNEMEEISGRDLDWFFDEWIYGGGHPHYEAGWRVTPTAYNSPAYDVEFAVSQMQDKSKNYFPFLMPLEIGVYHSGIEEIIPFTDSIGYQRFTVQTSYKPDSFVLDPRNKVLNEVVYHDNIDDVPDPGVAETRDTPQALPVLSADGVFKDFLHVRFSNPSAGRVSLSLFDITGRQVKSFYSGRSREFYRVYPLTDIPAGAYFLRLEQPGSNPVPVKVVKVR